MRNVLTPGDVETLDPMCGNWINRGLLCRVYPCINPEDRTDQYVTGEDYARGKTFFDEEYAKLGFWDVRKMGEEKTEQAAYGISDHPIPAPKPIEKDIIRQMRKATEEAGNVRTATRDRGASKRRDD